MGCEEQATRHQIILRPRGIYANQADIVGVLVGGVARRGPDREPDDGIRLADDEFRVSNDFVFRDFVWRKARGILSKGLFPQAGMIGDDSGHT